MAFKGCDSCGEIPGVRSMENGVSVLEVHSHVLDVRSKLSEASQSKNGHNKIIYPHLSFRYSI